MSQSPSSTQWLRAGLILVLLLIGYSVGSGIVYLLWSRLFGWPVVEGEREVLLRLVHLLPALACSVVAGAIGGTTNRMKALLPSVLLGFGIALIHYASYSRPSRTSANDVVAAMVESVVLFVGAFGPFWIVASRRMLTPRSTK
jgi:hypothetical protein